MRKRHLISPYNQRSKWRFLLILIPVVLLGGAFLLWQLYLPGYLKRKLEAEVKNLEIASLEIGILPLEVRLHGIRLRQGDTRDSAVHVDAAHAEIPVHLSSFTSHEWHFGKIHAVEAHVTLWEGPLHFPEKEEPKGEPFLFDYEGAHIENASFTYRKDFPKGAAYIRFPRVEVRAEPYGNYGEAAKGPAQASATALFEKSGMVDLKVKAWLFEKGPKVDVALQLQGQNLSEVNEYFEPADGATLEGILLDGKAHVTVEGRRAEGQVETRFKDLKIRFKSYPNKRSGFSAFLNNLGAAIKVKDENIRDKEAAKEKGVVTARHDNESVVSFIIRTMKEAAILIATD